jgi:hypothetical protein
MNLSLNINIPLGIRGQKEGGGVMTENIVYTLIYVNE